MKKTMHRYLRMIFSSAAIFKPVWGRGTGPVRKGIDVQESCEPRFKAGLTGPLLQITYYFTGGKMTKWARLFFAQAASSWPLSSGISLP